MNVRRFVWIATGLVVFFFLSSVAPGQARVQAQGPVPRGPFYLKGGIAASFDGDLRTLKAGPPRRPAILPLRGRSTESGSISGLTGETPALGEDLLSGIQMPSPTASFNGIRWTNVGWPPDTNGDVGPNDYVQAVNISFAVYSKTGSLLAGPATFDSLFAPLGTSTPCGSNNNQGDPIVLYDQLADRWLVSDFGFDISLRGVPLAPFYQCIAVSKSGDPVSGGWYLYALLADSSLLNDYPKFGLWPDAYYMTANMFNLSTNAVFVRVWALDRASMLNGSINAISFDLPTCSPTAAACPYFSLLPGNMRGAQPPAGSPNYLANIETANTTAALPFSSSVLHFWKFHVDWTTPSDSNLTGPSSVSVATFYEPLIKSTTGVAMDVVPQSSTTTKLDSLGDRLMFSLQYRNIGGAESLWATHTVVVRTIAGRVTAVRWYQFSIAGGAFSLLQQGNVVSRDGTWRWMPSIAVDQRGDALVGYSVSSSRLFPGIRYAGRLVTDTLGRMAQGEAVLVKGGGSQTSYPGLGAITRWGDYSAMTIDPSDDCTFWYTNEYYTTSGYKWSTRIGSTKFSTCP